MLNEKNSAFLPEMQIISGDTINNNHKYLFYTASDFSKNE